MKTLAELRGECAALGIALEARGRAGKEPFLAALQDYHWRTAHPDEPLPAQVMPMLLGSWNDLTSAEAAAIERDQHAWCVQEKKDGVRALLHVGRNGVRITGRTISQVSYRLSEFQANLPHLVAGLDRLAGTILDGELVCPVAEIDTGATTSAHPLQAAVAILAAGPEKARLIQDRQKARLRFHAFDLLSHLGRDVTHLPLYDRLELLRRAAEAADNPHLEIVPTYVAAKAAFHDRIVESGGEGTVWKRLDSPYEPGERSRLWLKRKAELTVEAVVIGSKPATPGKGHEGLVGAVEFGRRGADGAMRSIAWVSAWPDDERRSMTQVGPSGELRLSPVYLGRRAWIAGLDLAAKSGRMRHARLVSWIDL
ncbi:hypothetical protein [Paludisphaera sp.]|uniref:ATP-dependent DNA ligase n=1 Tax=Paludisphaera sp. TaxID=2017432 RepID=UPI00301BD214